jgi:hypothetical protein
VSSRGGFEAARLMEIPVSVTPLLRLPAHASFALLRDDAAFERTVRWHAARGIPLAWVIHLIDLCDTAGLDLAAGRWARRLLCRAGEQKRARLRRMVDMIRGHFEVRRADQWVRSKLDRLADPLDRQRSP